MDITVFLVLIILLGLLFDYTNGFHDAANVVSTVIATRALTPLVAILMAGVLNTIGATFIGGVAQTISSGLVDPKSTTQLVIIAALFGAIVWNFITWYFGIPSSSSYALVGGLVGASFAHGGSSVILWDGVIFKVLIPMVISPLIGFFLSFVLMRALYVFIPFFARRRAQKVFKYGQILSSSMMALAHGLNDAQKSMGIITLGLFASGVVMTMHIPLWVILACAITIGIGTATGGLRIIKTVGFEITKIEPMQGFASEISSSFVILFASFLGMPLSSTHIIVGSVTGIGSAKGFSSVKWKVTHKLIMAWILTLPGTAAASYGIYKMTSYYF